MQRRQMIPFAAGFGSLAAALTLQYGFGLRPCTLCVYARVPYVAMAAVGLFAPRLFFLTAAAAAAVALYQVGIERELWQFVCTGPADFLHALPVPCTDPPRRFGISLAEVNALWALLLSGYSFRMFYGTSRR